MTEATGSALRSVADLIDAIQDYERAHPEEESVYFRGPIKIYNYDNCLVGQLVFIDHGIWNFSTEIEE